MNAHDKINQLRLIIAFAAVLILISILVSCDQNRSSPKISTIIIFHAGSLSVPVRQIADSFMSVNPDIKVLTEAAGSVECARKITELNKPCDIIATSDYKVIEQMLIPDHTGWHIPFAGNELGIAYTPKSKKNELIEAGNWHEILLNDSVFYGRANPDQDPCGYRTVMLFQLAERHYNSPGLADNLMNKDDRFIRPKEVDLLALLEAFAIDYIFIYRSVAVQHGLKFLSLPDEINLKDPAFADNYATASLEILGGEKGVSMKVTGEPMVYGISMLDDAPNKEAALQFLEFFLGADKGMKIMEENGQPSVIPVKSIYYEKIPGSLQKFVSK